MLTRHYFFLRGGRQHFKLQRKMKKNILKNINFKKAKLILFFVSIIIIFMILFKIQHR